MGARLTYYFVFSFIITIPFWVIWLIVVNVLRKQGKPVANYYFFSFLAILTVLTFGGLIFGEVFYKLEILFSCALILAFVVCVWAGFTPQKKLLIDETENKTVPASVENKTTENTGGTEFVVSNEKIDAKDNKPTVSIEERLKTVSNLFNNGLISQEEYDKKRHEILSEL